MNEENNQKSESVPGMNGDDKEKKVEQRLGLEEPKVEHRRETDNDLMDLVKVVLGSQKDFIARQAKMERSRNFFGVVKTSVVSLAVISVVLLYSMGFNEVYQMFQQGEPEGEYAAFINIEGPISASAQANGNAIIASLRRAFKDDKAKGIVIRVNSPGGSPVQSDMVYEYIMRKKVDYDRPVIVVAEDIVASGAYYISSAADEIYINKNTLAGSIGVKVEGFGLSKAIQKFGIERRVFANSPAKVRGDMYTNLTADDKDHIQNVIVQTHRNFIAAVEAGRGKRLTGDKKVLFSGDIFMGDQAIAMGLVDGYSDLYSVLDKKYGVEYIRNYTIGGSPLANLMSKLSTSAASGFISGMLSSAFDQPQVMSDMPPLQLVP